MEGSISPVGGGSTGVGNWFTRHWNDAFTPKSIVCLREGYGRQFLMRDIVAGLTVAIIALPLSMALAIGSHLKPEVGLYAAIVGGFLISLLGGSRVQVGGPAGAFMIMIAGIVDKYSLRPDGTLDPAAGYQALAICTLMAGVILIIMGLVKLGALIKFIPYPVTTGFTSGIAVIIFSSQVKDFLGLTIAITDETGHTTSTLPREFLAMWGVLLTSLGSANIKALGMGVGALIVMALIRRFAPRIPGAIIVVVASAILVAGLHWSVDAGHTNGGVETLGTRFGGIPRTLPSPGLPVKLSSWADAQVAWEQARHLIPEATTIALLCAIESLLCAVVADGMIGGRHKSNCELVAQGVANIGSILFGGMPTTGVIARTAANIKNGGRTPLAGMIHSVTLLLLMLTLAPYASMIPLSVLAAVLVLVAWNMAEIDHFRTLLRAPRSDVAVLLTTFGLTVLTDLTIAVGVGMILAAILFMRRMSEVTNVGLLANQVGEESGQDNLADLQDPNALSKRTLPQGVEVYEINGPFFFGVADRLKDTLRGLERPPKVFILRMRRVPAVDATGMHALEEFHGKCERQHTQLLLAGVHAQPMFAMTQYGLIDRIGESNMFENLDDALVRAAAIVGAPVPAAPEHVPEVARERQRGGDGG
jgi:SulP family sulfate permease